MNNEHDKATMVEAIDNLVSRDCSAEIAEFTEDLKQLSEASKICSSNA